MMTVPTIQTTTIMLWPDGHLDIPEELRRALGIEGGWQCTIEISDGALIVRPQEAIPDEDMWAYESETHARLLEAGRQPIGTGIRLSPGDLRALAEGRVEVEELIAQSKP